MGKFLNLIVNCTLKQKERDRERDGRGKNKRQKRGGREKCEGDRVRKDKEIQSAGERRQRIV